MKDKVFFIDLSGNIIENEEIESHIGLAIYILDNNEELKKQFENSNYERQDLFLINEIGYTLGYHSQYDSRLIINREKATPAKKKTEFEFVKQGYKFEFTTDENVKRRF